MATEISAQFEVTDWQEDEFDAADGTAKLTTVTATKTYTGDIEGTSVTKWAMAYAADGNAAFVGIERITGTVGGRSGSVTVQHVGKFEDGAAVAELAIVDGAGSGDLVAATGSGTFRADPAGTVQLILG